MHQTVGAGIDAKRESKRNCALQPGANERESDLALALAQHPQRDLGTVAEQRMAEDSVPRSDDRDNLTALRVRLHDIRAVDPRMAAAYSLFAAR